ncbi:hypothetical protein AAY473_018654 [Plecturocebus cupreus]
MSGLVMGPHRACSCINAQSSQPDPYSLSPSCKGLSTHFGKPRRVNHLKSGVPDQPGQHGETPSLLKIQKLAGRGGTCLGKECAWGKFSALLTGCLEINSVLLSGQGQSDTSLSPVRKLGEYFGRLRQADHLSPGVQKQPGQQRDPISTNKKLARHGGTCLWSQLLGRLRRKDEEEEEDEEEEKKKKEEEEEEEVRRRRRKKEEEEREKKKEGKEGREGEEEEEEERRKKKEEDPPTVHISMLKNLSVA